MHVSIWGARPNEVAPRRLSAVLSAPKLHSSTSFSIQSSASSHSNSKQPCVLTTAQKIVLAHQNPHVNEGSDYPQRAGGEAIMRSHPSYLQIPILLVLIAGAGCRFEPRGQSTVDARLGAGVDQGPSRATPGDGGTGSGSDGPGATGTVCGSVCEAERSDGCCPVGCTAASDLDCVAQCGNGVLEKGEQCDPPASCPAACPNRGCTKFTLEGSAGECTAICKEAGQETACKPGDGCCPMGCTVADDDDCAVMCGNGAKEGNETCDPLASCPTACPAEGCQIRKLINAGTCTAECVTDRLQTACMPGDGCCPPGCHAGNDADCTAVCDNGIKENGETCDPLASCATACPANECQLRKLVNGGTCKAQCEDDRKETACKSGDDCCPPGCNSANDMDCGVMCNNGIKEMSETCDPLSSCPTSCPAMGCQLRELKNAGTCKAVCENSRTQTACASNDDCCPPACNANNDNDCQPKCGNGVVEQGEKCEPVAECERRQGACRSDRDTIREGRGNAGQCAFECVESARRCGDADGQCPSGCQSDPDCKRTNGSECTSASQCLSNRCTDNRCCAETCGPCERCTGGGGTCQLPSGTRVCGQQCKSTNECCDSCNGQCQTCNPAMNRCVGTSGGGCSASGGRPGTCQGGTCVANCAANQGQACGPECNRGSFNCQGQCSGMSPRPGAPCSGGGTCNSSGNCDPPCMRSSCEPSGNDCQIGETNCNGQGCNFVRNRSRGSSCVFQQEFNGICDGQGRCLFCGRQGDPCCPGNNCEDEFTCNSGTCE
jgi:hypothetical protein